MHIKFLENSSSNTSKVVTAAASTTDTTVDWRKTYNLKVVSYVLFGDLTEDYSPGDSLSDSSEEVREESGYIGVFLLKKQTLSWTSKIIANHKEQTTQFNDFSYFLLYGKVQESGVIEITALDMHRASIQNTESFLFFSILNSPQGTLSGQLQCLMAGNIYCLLAWQATFFVRNMNLN